MEAYALVLLAVEVRGSASGAIKRTSYWSVTDYEEGSRIALRPQTSNGF